MSIRPSISDQPKGLKRNNEITDVVKFQQKYSWLVVLEPDIATNHLNCGVI